MSYLVARNGVLLTNSLGVLKTTSTDPAEAECCCGVTCPPCADPLWDEVILEFSGWPTPGGCCATSNLNNDSYSLLRGGSGNGCEWIGHIDCVTEEFGIALLFSFEPTYMEVFLLDEQNGNQIVWRRNYSSGASGLDCESELGGNFVFESQNFEGNCGSAEFVTCTVTPVIPP